MVPKKKSHFGKKVTGAESIKVVYDGLIYVARKNPFECLKGSTSICLGQFDIQHI